MILALLAILIVGPFKPDPALTPGAVRTDLSVQQMCSIRWGKDRRFVTEKMRRDVFAAYHIPYEKHALYELDHLVPRSLLGQDSVLNLWPEPLDEAKHLKDPLEVALGKMVCRGSLSLEAAQTAIRTDWKAAYKKYLGDVPPASAKHHVANQRRRHTKAARKVGARRPAVAQSTDLAHVVSREFRGGSVLATTDALRVRRRASAPFRGHVLRIVGQRAEKQMRRIDAGRIVAAVAHRHPFRDRADVQQPRDAMRATLWQGEIAHGTVAARESSASPQPTRIGLLNLTPKGFDGIAPLRDGSARRTTTVTGSTQFDLRARSRERLLANGADEMQRCGWIDSRASARLRAPTTKRLLHRPENVAAVAATFVESAPATLFVRARRNEFSEPFTSRDQIERHARMVTRNTPEFVA